LAAGDAEVDELLEGRGVHRVVVEVGAVVEATLGAGGEARRARAQLDGGAVGVHVVAAGVVEPYGDGRRAAERPALVLPLEGERELAGAADGPEVPLQGDVAEGAELLVHVEADIPERPGRGALVRPGCVVLAVGVDRPHQAGVGAEAVDQPTVAGDLPVAGAELGLLVLLEARDQRRLPVRAPEDPAAPEPPYPLVAGAHDPLEPVRELGVHLGSLAEGGVGARVAEHRAGANDQARSLLERGFEGERLDDAAEGVGAVEGGGAAAGGLNGADRAGVDGEEILVGALAVGAGVEADPVEEQHRLLAGAPTEERGGLPVARLLDKHAGLVAERVGGGPGQPLVHVPAGGAGPRAPGRGASVAGTSADHHRILGGGGGVLGASGRGKEAHGQKHQSGRGSRAHQGQDRAICPGEESGEHPIPCSQRRQAARSCRTTSAFWRPSAGSSPKRRVSFMSGVIR
jgi:hypothetical protein